MDEIQRIPFPEVVTRANAINAVVVQVRNDIIYQANCLIRDRDEIIRKLDKQIENAVAIANDEPSYEPDWYAFQRFSESLQQIKALRLSRGHLAVATQITESVAEPITESLPS